MCLSLASLSYQFQLLASFGVTLITEFWKKWKMTLLWIQPVTVTLPPTSAPGEDITGMTMGTSVMEELQGGLTVVYELQLWKMVRTRWYVITTP